MNLPVSLPPIVRATHAEAAAAADVIAEAFADLAAAAWLVPKPADRQPILAANMRIWVDHALDHGEVHILDDRSAVAVWFHRDATPLPPPSDYGERLAAACGPYTDRFQILDTLFDAHHPTVPHHHLALLAVTPRRQGTGWGTALLRHHHTRLDAHAIPAYLEASSTGNRDLYTRHGYHTRPPFTLPDGTPFWPMWRPPHQCGHTAAAGEVPPGGGAATTRSTDQPPWVSTRPVTPGSVATCTPPPVRLLAATRRPPLRPKTIRPTARSRP